MLTVSAVVVAAGSGRRFGGPKQFAVLQGRPLLYWSLRTFQRTPSVREIILVVSKDRVEGAQKFVRQVGLKKVRAVVAGGFERADSVRAGWAAVAAKTSVVLIHDAARALVTRDLVERVAQAAQRTGVSLAAHPVADTVKSAGGRGGRILVNQTVPRKGLWLAQTPQGFRSDVLKRVGPAFSSSLTDDVQAAERRGIPVEIVPGSARNFKVTLPEDFELCRALLGYKGRSC